MRKGINTLIKQHIGVFFCFIFLFGSKIYAQNSDLNAWTSINVEYQKKKFEFGLEQELRFNQKITKLRQYFSNLSVEYKVLKNLKFGVEYRFILSPKPTISEKFQRYAIFGSVKHKINILSLSGRLKYQMKEEVFYPEDEQDPNVNKLRGKLSVEIDIPKWNLDPKFSGEIFRAFEEDVNPSWDKYRLSIGTKYKINKHNSFSFAYLIDGDLQTVHPFYDHIIALNYIFKL